MDLRMSVDGGPPAPSMIRVKKKATWEVTTWGKLYALFVTLECLSLVVLCILSLLYAHNHSDEEVDASSVEYTSVTAMVASCALLYFSLDSILLENIFQFYCALVLHALITAYVIWHYCGQGDTLGAFYDKIALWVMVGVCIFQAIYIPLAFKVRETFGWRLYKRVGTNPVIRDAYKTATIFMSLLKLDFALGVILLLLSVFYLLKDTSQIIINVVAAVCTLGWLVLGFSSVQRESTRLAVCFFLFGLIEPAFLIYKLITMKLNNPSPDPDADPTIPTTDDDEYPVFSWREFLMTGCVAVAVRLACILWAVWCVRNFGRGLKERVWAQKSSTAVAHQHQHAQGYDHGPIVVVESEHAQETSGLREYIQPLL